MIEAESIWPHFKKLGLGESERFRTALEQFLPRLTQLGITSILDAGTFHIEEESYQALSNMDHNGSLPLRYFASTMITDSASSKNAYQRLVKYNSTYATPHFSINTFKIINDNSDDDAPDILFEAQQLSSILKPLLSRNCNIMLHTSNAHSVSVALDALEHSKQSSSRITLAHVNMVKEKDFIRMKKLGVIANIQPFNADGEGYYTYRYMLYGEPWKNKLVRFKTFLNHKIPTSGSSDYPACNQEIEGCSPLHGVESAVTRQKIGSSFTSAVLPSAYEKLSLREALYIYTMGGAYQLGREKEIGSLQKGKKGDLVILEQNPFSVSAKQIHSILVYETIMDGVTRFKR